MQGLVTLGGAALVALPGTVFLFSSSTTTIPKPWLVFRTRCVGPVWDMLLLLIEEDGGEGVDVVLWVAVKYCVPGSLAQSTSHSFPVDSITQPDGPVMLLLTCWGDFDSREDGEVVGGTHEVGGILHCHLPGPSAQNPETLHADVSGSQHGFKVPAPL